MSQPSSEHAQRVGDAQVADLVAEIEAEDVRARENGEAHGNYGEDFGMVLLDLRDCRAALAESQQRERAFIADESDMRAALGADDDADLLMVAGALTHNLAALQQQHDALRAEHEKLRHKWQAMADQPSSEHEQRVSDDVFAAMEREAASGEPTPPQGGQPE